MNRIVTCVDSLLFLGASITCRASGCAGGLVLSVPKAGSDDPGRGMRADFKERAHIITKHSLTRDKVL